MGTANLILLTIGLILQAFLGMVLFRKRTYWEFPFFFVYTAYSVIGTTALLATNSRYDLYYYAFWANEAGSNVLAILTLHEVFRKVFFGFYVQSRWFRLLFPFSAVLAVLIVLWSTAHSRHLLTNHLMSLILALGISANFIQVALFCLFMAIARTFHLRWQFAPLGIILGFALDSIGTAIGYWARSKFGTSIENFLVYVSPVAYILAIVVWLDTFFFRPEPGPGSLSAATMLQLAKDMRRDTMIMKKIMGKLK